MHFFIQTKLPSSGRSRVTCGVDCTADLISLHWRQIRFIDILRAINIENALVINFSSRKSPISGARISRCNYRYKLARAGTLWKLRACTKLSELLRLVRLFNVKAERNVNACLWIFRGLELMNDLSQRLIGY